VPSGGEILTTFKRQNLQRMKGGCTIWCILDDVMILTCSYWVITFWKFFSYFLITLYIPVIKLVLRMWELRFPERCCRSRVFWDDPEDGGKTRFRNVRNYLPSDAA